MKTKEYVQSLFKDYEESDGLKDFMEELQSNLDARIESLIKNGLSEQEAFDKASAELGDISALADELSLKKRREVFEEVYLDIRKYMSSGRVAAYVVFGVVALFGIIVGLIVLFATRGIGSGFGMADLDLTAFFGAMMPFLTAAITGFTWLGVTQETSSMYPVSKKRGAWYATAAGLIAFGLLTMPIVYFSTRIATDFISGFYYDEFFDGSFEVLVPVLGLMIPFVLPGIGILVYLILTEKSRLKPWAAASRLEAEKQSMEIWNDPQGAMRFGMFSGAIWIFAFAIFILLGFLIGFKYSWLAFIFATAIQLVVQGLMMKKKS